MKSKKVLLFDFDGTLADSIPLIRQILFKLSKKYKLKVLVDKDFEALREKSARDIIKLLKIPKFIIPFLALDLKKSFQQQVLSVPLVEGIKKVLTTLHKQGYVLGVLTSNGRENVTTFFKNTGIDFIDFIYADVQIFGKAKSIQTALERNKILKEEVVYIGDEIRDIEAAKKVGISIISVGWGFNSEKALKEALPDYFAKEPIDLLGIVSKI